MAEDRAEQLNRDPDKVVQELDKRLRADLRKTGDFNRVHPMPSSGQDVPDDLDTRLVVLGIDHPYGKESNSPAEVAASQRFGVISISFTRAVSTERTSVFAPFLAREAFSLVTVLIGLQVAAL